MARGKEDTSTAPTQKAGKPQGEPKKGRTRAPRLDPQLRRQAILAAALAEFGERGFSSARMEDVAARAGVAKGTVYLYFEDKKALFEGLVREAIDPVLGLMERQLAAFPGTTRQLLEMFIGHVVTQVVETPRRDLVRLMIGEGERFPDLADFYFAEVVARGLRLLRAINERALARGEITSDIGLRFPQLFIAPLLIAVTWDGLFGRHEPLDVRDMLNAHVELILRGLGWRET